MEQDGDADVLWRGAFATRIGSDDIEQAVVVQIGDNDVEGSIANAEVERRRKGAVAVTEVNEDFIGSLVGQDDVRIAVAVDVSRGDARRRRRTRQSGQIVVERQPGNGAKPEVVGGLTRGGRGDGDIEITVLIEVADGELERSRGNRKTGFQIE